MLCRYEGTNRAWDEGPLCHVVPFGAFSTPRSASARCAEVIPINVSRISRGFKSALCRVVPCRACSTLRGAKARCADCGFVSVVPPNAVGCISSVWSVHAPTWLSINALAQPAHPADRVAREILAILGRDTTCSRRLMRNPLGESYAKLISITNCSF